MRKKSDPDIITLTQDFWETRMDHRPSQEEAEEMVCNVVNLFRLLMDWDSRENQEEEESESEDFQSEDVSLNRVRDRKQVG